MAAVLGRPAGEIDGAQDLFELGLDSLGLMALVGGWRRAGSAVTFADLTADPRLDAWVVLLAESAAAAPSSPSQAAANGSGGGDCERAENQPFPLATMQHAYWIGRQDEQPLGGVAAHFYVEFDGHDLDPARLATAFTRVLRRHPQLRARVLPDGTQVIGQPGEQDRLTVHDLRSLPESQREQRLQRLRDHHTHRRMAVDKGEMVDLALSLLPGGATRLHLDLDMIAADAVSLRILLDDLRHCYQYPGQPRPELGYRFDRYLRDRAAGQQQAADQAREWWAQRLAGLPLPPALPTVIGADEPTPPGSAYARTTRHSHWIEPARLDRLKTRARAHALTVSAALATAFAEVLAALSGQSEFLLNLPLFDREPLHPDVAGLVGDFSSSLLLHVELGTDRSFADQAHAVQRRLHTGVEHGAYSGIHVLRDLARLHDLRQLLAPVVYTSAVGLGPVFSDPVRACFGEPVWIISQGPQVWLDAQVTELADGLLLNWDVREHAFRPGVVDAAFAAYRQLVGALIDDPTSWTRPALPEIAHHERPVAEGEVPRPRGLHEAFFAHAARAPRRIALVTSAGERVSYGDLAGLAGQIAAELTSRGLRAGDAVAVSLPRGVRQVATVLGVLRAGGCYVPVGPDQPPARRDYVLAAARTRFLIDATGLHERGEQPPGDPAVAYVLFTSGSTGTPKGVEVGHAAAAHTIDVLNARYRLGPEDRSLALAGLDFDMSVYDLFAPLSAGGSVVLIDDTERRDAACWAHLVREHGVTVLNCVPTLLDMLVSAGAPLGDSLRLVLVGGDRVAPALPARLAERAPGCRFVALGGMTEAAIHSTVNEDTADPACWGVPLPGVRCRVVDERGRDCPDWVTGRLWVGGAGVATGYRGDPAGTAASFVTHEGIRWFISGDLARYRPDGTLEFLGRADHQVKLRGHRIEPGEIEAALRGPSGVEQAAAVLVEAPAPKLAAAVTGPAVAVADVLASARATLPDHMVPDHIAVWPELPLSANGKPDRKAIAARLAAELESAAPAPADPPSGPVEQAVAEVWARLLGRDTVNAGDDFFRLGGDSLLATRAVRELNRLGVRGATVAALFAAPVLRVFATTVTLADAAPDAVVVPDPIHRHEPFPLTDAQRAYWIGRADELPLGGVGTNHYTEFDGAEVDLTRLTKAWRRLIDRHEALRTVIDTDGRQRVLAKVPAFHIPVTENDFRAELAHRRADLGRWPLFDVRAQRYTRDGQQRTRVGISLDYSVLDARSIMLLYAELDQLYRDPDARLAPIGMSFRDYVLQAGPAPEAVERDQRYWTDRLADLPPAPALPLAVDPATVTRPRFVRRGAWLEPRVWQAVGDRARQWGLTPSTLLLACYAEVLAAWSGQAALAVTLTLFNREDAHPDAGRVLGDFTTLALTSYDRAPDEPWLSAARRLHHRLGRDLDHRAVSAVDIAQRQAHRQGEVAAVVPVVFTSSVGVGADLATDPPESFGEPVWGLSTTPQVWLDNQVIPARGGVSVQWDAVEELFPAGVLDAMFAAYTRLLHWAADAAADEPLPALLPEAQRTVRDRINATNGPVPGQLLHSGFLDSAGRAGDAVALLWPGGRLSYAELADRARRVAAGLLDRGLRPGNPVTITLPKGPEQISAVLGVLLGGGVYVPVGADQPAARRDRIRAVAGRGLAIGADGLDMTELLTAPPLATPVHREPGDLAYVIFTSGSTGEPKGVEISHRAAVNTITDINRRYRVGSADRVFGLAALDFDLSVYDIFGTLAAGGALVLPEESDRREPTHWLALLAEHEVTVWNSVPALLDMLLTAVGDGSLPECLRLALVSGDWVGLDLAPRLHDCSAGRAALVALGGATEAAIWSNVTDVDRVPGHWTSVPYGVPLRNQHHRVVDPFGRDCPDWTAGELWIGGTGVAAGYRCDPRLTATKFAEHRGERWYRTGDLARYWPDGTLEFLGRMDHQVKIGGHRIEPGEIEAALETHPAVRRAVVVAAGSRGSRHLHGFVQVGTELDSRELTTHLTSRVPRYAVPGRIDQLAELPLTGNGKVDRAALAELAARAPATAGEPPTGEVEQRIAAAWADLLGAEIHDRTANFFACGGTSLSALRLLGTLRQLFTADITTRDFLAAPTIADLAAHIQAQTMSPSSFEIGVL